MRIVRRGDALDRKKYLILQMILSCMCERSFGKSEVGLVFFVANKLPTAASYDALAEEVAGATSAVENWAAEMGLEEVATGSAAAAATGWEEEAVKGSAEETATGWEEGAVKGSAAAAATGLEEAAATDSGGGCGGEGGAGGAGGGGDEYHSVAYMMLWPARSHDTGLICDASASQPILSATRFYLEIHNALFQVSDLTERGIRQILYTLSGQKRMKKRRKGCLRQDTTVNAPSVCGRRSTTAGSRCRDRCRDTNP